MTILEWDGYQAAGTKAQTTKGIVFGKDYTDEFGANGLAYSLITNDSQAIGKVRTGSKFDVLHPCAENFKDYVDAGFVRPRDTSALPGFINFAARRATSVKEKQDIFSVLMKLARLVST